MSTAPNLKTRVTLAAARTLSALAPEYAAWPASQQEKWRAGAQASCYRDIKRELCNTLFNQRLRSENGVDRFIDNLEPDQQYLLNWAKLLVTGVGEEFVFLNESLPDDTTLLDFETLYQYAKKDHDEQESYRTKEWTDYTPRATITGPGVVWIRAILDGRLRYITAVSLSYHVEYRVRDELEDELARLIPHTYEPGPEHGKKTGHGYRYDMRVNAQGREPHLRELQSRTNQYLGQLTSRVDTEAVRFNQGIYMVPGDAVHDPDSSYFVFKHPDTMHNVRWTHFVSDCAKLQAPTVELNLMLEKEKASAMSWLKSQYGDVMKNFQPGV